MKKSFSFIILCSIACLVGCGTIIHGTTQELGLTSDPTGATVIIDGNDHGESPVTAELSRKDKHTVLVTLDGYQSHEMIVNRKVSGWVWGNIVFGGLIGLGVDAITGGMYKLDPEEIHARLSRSSITSADVKDGTIYIAIVLAPDPSWEKIGQLERTAGH